MAKGQGFGFGLGQLKEAFQKAKQVQEGAKKLQEELEQMEIQGQSSDGSVKVILSGNQEPRRVEISPEAVAQGAQTLSELVTEAMTDAYNKSTETMRTRMEELTSGLNLPGM
ncbi:nucleoid-associated protein, YbaB/EbfC family [Hydrococcus rivularis NIES-593]|uniref:Nucleoid-associated protein NIES593_08845 n=1 Tax=Hydrococcus rivularis NIES-593 TaxID=1921803 RepID=A0A1U7HJP6_9CYAN|nr:YbaB/EbfC family nucleoid-associated protein [Hydrococcus rivularis]OKH23758.1 nucleoid-associated protein, YbaB/EbfC family [Hydrococcus rivularis NIES-593]